MRSVDRGTVADQRGRATVLTYAGLLLALVVVVWLARPIITSRMTAASVRGNGRESNELCDRARYLRRQRDAASLARSRELLRRAIFIDPGNARAHAELADSYSLSAFQHFGPEPRAEAIETARHEARRALDLDVARGSAHATLAAIAFYYDWDWVTAEREFRNAVSRGGDARTHAWFALALAARGRFDEAEAQAREAVSVDPATYAVANELGVVFYTARRFADCERHARASLETEPKAHGARALRGACLSASGKWSEAAGELRRALEASGARDSSYVGRLGHALALMGHDDQARALRDELAARMQTDPANSAWIHVAFVEAGLGESAAALEAIEKAIAAKETDVVFLGVEPLWDALREQPRFRAALAKVQPR